MRPQKALCVVCLSVVLCIIPGWLGWSWRWVMRGHKQIHTNQFIQPGVSGLCINATSSYKCALHGWTFGRTGHLKRDHLQPVTDVYTLRLKDNMPIHSVAGPATVWRLMIQFNEWYKEEYINVLSCIGIGNKEPDYTGVLCRSQTDDVDIQLVSH